MPSIHVASACHRCLAGLFLLFHEASQPTHLKEFQQKGSSYPCKRSTGCSFQQFQAIEYQLKKLPEGLTTSTLRHARRRSAELIRFWLSDCFAGTSTDSTP